MRREEIFDAVVNIVCKACVCRPETVLNSKCHLAIVVDARCIALEYLTKVGFRDDIIAHFALRKELNEDWPDWGEITKKARGYNQLRKTFTDRMATPLFRETVREVENEYQEFLKKLQHASS